MHSTQCNVSINNAANIVEDIVKEREDLMRSLGDENRDEVLEAFWVLWVKSKLEGVDRCKASINCLTRWVVDQLLMSEATQLFCTDSCRE